MARSATRVPIHEIDDVGHALQIFEFSSKLLQLSSIISSTSIK